MEWRAGMIRRREEKKGLGRLGMGGGREGLRGARIGWGSPCQDARGSSFWRKDTYRLLSPRLPIVFSLRRVYTPIKVVEREGRWVICSFWCVSKVFDALCQWHGISCRMDLIYPINCLTTHSTVFKFAFVSLSQTRDDILENTNPVGI